MKPRSSIIFAVISGLLLTASFSCKSKLQKPEFANFANPPDYKYVILRFKNNWPKKLSMDQTAVIEMGFTEIPAIGLCSFDSDNDEISLALMTTTGMKLIEIQKLDGKINNRFSIPELAKNKNSGKQLIEDVSTIYIHPQKKYDYCEIRKNSLVYGWTENIKNRTELVFGIKKGEKQLRLMEKRVYFDNNPVSYVYYSDYKMDIPMTVSYINKKFGYSLILKTQKVYYDQR